MTKKKTYTHSLRSAFKSNPHLQQNYIYPMLKEQVRVTPVDANTLQIPAAGSCSKCEGVKMKYNHN